LGTHFSRPQQGPLTVTGTSIRTVHYITRMLWPLKSCNTFAILSMTHWAMYCMVQLPAQDSCKTSGRSDLPQLWSQCRVCGWHSEEQGSCNRCACVWVNSTCKWLHPKMATFQYPDIAASNPGTTRHRRIPENDSTPIADATTPTGPVRGIVRKQTDAHQRLLTQPSTGIFTFSTF
jgi:hypothetical protein